MSDAINHYLCAKDLLEEGPISFPVNERLLFLGSQGPDIFLYYNVLESQESKIPLGDRLHKEQINDFFYHGLLTCLHAPESYKPILRSYYIGMICHHALDVATHPFIFYRSGSYLEDRPETLPFKHNHKKYEIQLDMAYYHMRTGEKAHNFQVHRLFDVPAMAADILEYFYAETLKATFGISMEKGTVRKSLEKAKKLTRVLSDPTGLKRLAVGFGEILAGDPGKFSTAFYGIKPMDPTLVLNLDKSIWRHPCDDTQAFTDSYPELCQKAQEDIRQKIPLIDPMLLGQKEVDRTVLDNCFKDLGYETGLDWKTSPPIQYFDPIL
ncbi:zinc dependent phospholipase C family protein [Alkalibacter rhizosphaerae]|uniref:Zinc dependent phospholipase C family protein n=1 Tax=Alkalibacter rhizosphaerae TaxID=2815577 RepID=A0A975AHF9_9FIRM|nr:zinc dependent phospholipase C family protein [Alkalibacter rhizosphaerae]QSX07450.1 zinc dependent phospholipase C family protein [Alkalibacter rhizosphaerae]